MQKDPRYAPTSLVSSPLLPPSRIAIPHRKKVGRKIGSWLECARDCRGGSRQQLKCAGVAQLVERYLPKVNVVSSSLITRLSFFADVAQW